MLYISSMVKNRETPSPGKILYLTLVSVADKHVIQKGMAVWWPLGWCLLDHRVWGLANLMQGVTHPGWEDVLLVLPATETRETRWPDGLLGLYAHFTFNIYRGISNNTSHFILQSLRVLSVIPDQPNRHQWDLTKENGTSFFSKTWPTDRDGSNHFLLASPIPHICENLLGRSRNEMESLVWPVRPIKVDYLYIQLTQNGLFQPKFKEFLA